MKPRDFLVEGDRSSPQATAPAAWERSDRSAHPACAGNTFWIHLFPTTYKAHPRMRGEHGLGVCR